MNSDNLIESLRDDLEPVAPLASPLRRTAVVLLEGFAFSAIVLWLLGVRHLPSVRLPWFWLGEMALLVWITMQAVWCAFELSIPGGEVRRPWTGVVKGVFLWGLYLLSGTLYVLQTNGPLTVWPIEGISCALNIVGLALVPSTVIAIGIRTGYPTAPRWAAWAALTAGALFSVLGIEFHCVYESTSHHLAYHLAPVAVFGAVGWALGGRLFSRSEQSLPQ